MNVTEEVRLENQHSCCSPRLVVCSEKLDRMAKLTIMQSFLRVTALWYERTLRFATTRDSQLKPLC